jgi:3'-5' exoribonuclease
MDPQRFDFSNPSLGAERRGAVCLRSREERQTRGSKPYLVITVANSSGNSTAHVWSEALVDWSDIKVGDALDLHARTKPGYRGGAPELEILTFTRLAEDHPVRLELNAQCPVPREKLEMRLDHLIQSIRRPEARRLLTLLLDEHIGRDRFFAAPAAVMHHHGYIGGLAEHSIEVAEMALALADTKPYASHVDRDAVLVGALLHDIGKVDEYEWEGVPIRISRLGRLRSHVSRGPELVSRAVAGSMVISDSTLSEMDIRHLQHVMEAHHGLKEWGSPVPPRTLEATIIHHADCASARLRAMADDLSSAEADEEHWVDPSGWKRDPVWNFAASLAEETAPVAETEIGGGCDLPALDGLHFPVPEDEGETAAYILPPTAGDEAEDRWEAPILELGRPMTAWLVWLMARDLERWGDGRQCQLAKEEASALAHFLWSFLPEDMRTEIKSASDQKPMLRAS